MMHFRFVLVLFLVTTSTQGGTVHTLDGKIYEGDVRFENGQVVVHPKRGPLAKLELNDVLRANFQNAEPPRPAANVNGVLDRVWRMQDVGPTGTAGSARWKQSLSLSR